MAKAKGSEKTGGRKKGSVNKITADIKEMLNAALDEVGGQEYFTKQAKENPKAFMTLIGKMIPTAVNANIKTEPTLSELVEEAVKRRKSDIDITSSTYEILR